jgi:predicted Zn finger-like uncharacterized protein
MIVSCPACTARFVVDPALLGPHGRMVRCARCRETWHAEPTSEDLAHMVQPSEAFPEPVAEEEPPHHHEEEDVEAAHHFEPMEPPPEPHSEHAPEPEPEPPVTNWQSFANDSVPNFLTDSVRPPTAMGGTSRKSLVLHKPQRSPVKLVASAVIAALVVALIVLLVVGRTRIVALWPGAAPIYAAFGMHVALDETGLELQAINSGISQINGKRTLVISGRIHNIAGATRKVPPLVITLRDAKGKALKSWTYHAGDATLDADKGTDIHEQMASPPDDAVSATVAFAPAP